MSTLQITVKMDLATYSRESNKLYTDWIRSQSGESLIDAYKRLVQLGVGVSWTFERYQQPPEPPAGLTMQVVQIFSPAEQEERDRNFYREKFQRLLEEGADGVSSSAIDACRMVREHPWLIISVPCGG